MADTDPFYSRKPVPDEFIQGVGFTGQTNQQEYDSRERKLSSAAAGDLRRFSNPKKSGKIDPFYQRKPVPDELIRDIAPTGLTKEEEYLNRERKYSVNGVDVRKFGDGGKSDFKPGSDPYYGRKPVDKSEIEGVGETGLTAAEEYTVRENKDALFDLSRDPWKEITGQGHRASVSGPAIVAGSAEGRRRSSVAPHHVGEAHHSGYGGDHLAPIESRKENPDEITPSSSTHGGVGGVTHTGPTTTTTTTTTTSTSAFPHNSGTATYYDNATRDLAPHETE